MNVAEGRGVSVLQEVPIAYGFVILGYYASAMTALTERTSLSSKSRRSDYSVPDKLNDSKLVGRRLHYPNKSSTPVM